MSHHGLHLTHPWLWALILSVFFVAILLQTPAHSSAAKEQALPTEAQRCDAFLERYWDIVSSERLRAVELLKQPKESRTLWLLFATSYWDYEPQIRLKAFQFLTDAEDPFGYVSHLAAESFRLDSCTEVKAQKAEMMEHLRYRHLPLKALTDFVIQLRYPGYGESYDALQKRQCPFHRCSHSDCTSNPVCRWVVVIGRGSGIGAIHGHGDWVTVNDNRENINKILHAINYLGDANFKLRYMIEKDVRRWWEIKNPEFLEVDRRTRVVEEEARAEELQRRQREAKVQEEAALGLVHVPKLEEIDAGKIMLDRWLKKKAEAEADAEPDREIVARTGSDIPGLEDEE